MRKKELEALEAKEREKKQRVFDAISKEGEFSDDEKEIIYQINDLVMGMDGTAEGWGGYHYEPLDCLETSFEIFNLTKRFFAEKSEDQRCGFSELDRAANAGELVFYPENASVSTGVLSFVDA